MTKKLAEKYHEVYLDNFFTSVPLMEYFFLHKILCCGTLRTNKKYLPKNLSKDSDLKRGESDYRVSKDDRLQVERQQSCSCHFKLPWYRTVSGEPKK